MSWLDKYIKYFGWIIIFGSLLFSSCKATKYLQENEILLRKQKIVMHQTKKIENQRILSSDLTAQLKQKPNRKTLGLFYTRMWVYFKLQNSKSNSSFNKWLSRVVAQQPTLVDSLIATQTRDAMAGVLFNNGFYDGVVEYDIKRNGNNKADITYNVFPESPFKVRNLKYRSTDTIIEAFLPSLISNSLIVKGKRLNSADYELEALRLVRFFKNNGFANFNKSHISSLLVDTFSTNIDITLEVLPPNQSNSHQKYKLNNIQIFLDYNTNNAGQIPQTDTTINGVRLLSYAEKSPFKQSAIQKLIYFNPGDVYNQDNIDFTNKRLSSLPCFKFIKIKTDIDSIHNDKININILLTPSDKYSAGIDYDLNWETNTFLNQALIGTAVSYNHKSKNILKGGEVMNLSLETGIAVNPNPQNNNFINTIDFKFSNEFRIPKFSGFLGLYTALTKIPSYKHALVKQSMLTDMQKLATTSMLTSYSYTRIINLYDIQALNVGYAINYQKSNFQKYQINHLGVSFLNTKLDPKFDSLISGNIFLQRSLAERQLFTGLLFRDFTYTYVKPPNRWAEDWFGRINVESSGAEIWLANTLVNAFNKTDVNFSQSLKFSQFFKFEAEGRYSKKYTKNFVLATRIFSGILVPFGFSSQTPYVKQFFVGGPNSLRAWRIRELGPGKIIPSSDISTFYQTGNFKLEANAELRFPIFWYLKGAIFLDAGNVWDLDHSTYGQDGVLGWDFYKQVGVGSGIGFRADFNFFQIRFDAGIKLAEPGKWVFKPTNISLSDFNPNIAIGYPF